MNKRTKTIAIISTVIAIIIAILILLLVFYIPKKKREAELRERQRLVQEYWNNKFLVYQEENEKYSDYEVDVAFLGDSLTDGYNLEKYYPQFVTANRGIGGDTTFNLQNRFELSVYDLKPKVAVMLIGGNNLGTMLDNYEQMLIELKENLPKTKIVLVSLSAMGGNYKEKNQIATYNNVIIKKLADKYGYDFVDIFTPLFNEKTGEIYAEYTSDGVHFNERGYEVVTKAITPIVTKALNNN